MDTENTQDEDQLIAAIKTNNLSYVIGLLNKGVKTNFKHDGDSPLSHAVDCEKGFNFDMVKALLEHGACADELRNSLSGKETQFSWAFRKFKLVIERFKNCKQGRDFLVDYSAISREGFVDNAIKTLGILAEYGSSVSIHENINKSKDVFAELDGIKEKTENDEDISVDGKKLLCNAIEQCRKEIAEGLDKKETEG